MRVAPFALIRREILAAFRAATPDARRGDPGPSARPHPPHDYSGGDSDGDLRGAAVDEDAIPLLCSIHAALAPAAAAAAGPDAIIAAAVPRPSGAGGGGAAALAAGAPATAADAQSSCAIMQLAASGSGVANWVGALSSAVAGVNNTADSLARVLGGVAIVGPIFQVVSLVARAADMIGRMYANRRDLVDIHDQLRDLAHTLSREMVCIFSAGLRDRSFIDDIFDAVEHCWIVMSDVERHMLDRRRNQIWHVDEISSLTDDVSQVRQRVCHIRQLGFTTRVACELRREMWLRAEEQNERINQLFEPDLGIGPDVFRASAQIVPCPHQRVILSAIPKWDVLKSAVLNGLSNGAAVPVSKIVVHGSGGLGKTTACKLLANDTAVQDHFEHNVYFIELGQKVTTSEVVRSLAECVRFSGGRSLASRIAGFAAKDFAGALRETRQWFAHACKPMLFIVDNVWPRDQAGEREWADLLSDVPSVHGSCFLFTTRTDLLADFVGEDIHFDLLDVGTDGPQFRAAVEIFDKHLGVSDGHPRYNVDARNTFIRNCYGLPLSIARCGTLVKRRGYDWDEVMSGLGVSEGSFDGGEMGHISFDGICTLGLQYLNTPHGASPWLCEDAFSRLHAKFGSECCSVLYASLVVLARDAPRAPLHILARMWGEPLRVAKDVALMFKSYDLADIEPCEFVERAQMLTLHDLQRSRLECLCRHTPPGGMLNEVEPHVFHRRLIDGYCEEAFHEPLSPNLPWQKVVLPMPPDLPDNYMSQGHLIRHLEAAQPPGGDELLEACIMSVRSHVDFTSLEVGALEEALQNAHDDLLRDLQELGDSGADVDDVLRTIMATDAPVVPVDEIHAAFKREGDADDSQHIDDTQDMQAC